MSVLKTEYLIIFERHLAAGLRMGAYLREEFEKNEGGRPVKTGSKVEPVSETYRDLGIAKATAFRLQRLYDWQQETDGVTKAVERK